MYGKIEASHIRILGLGKTLPTNEDIAGVVPMATESAQAVLTEDIAAKGLLEPVVTYKGEIIDGRCRQKACVAANIQILYKELDDELPVKEVIAFVKSWNTRRNLTRTQEVMVAARSSLNDPNMSAHTAATAWGVSRALVTNARWLYTNHPKIAKTLFDGQSVELNGKATNKVSAIYAHLRALNDNTVPNEEYGWQEDTYIATQAGKNWYYKQKAMLGNDSSPKTLQLVAELANYKYPVKNVSEADDQEWM